MKIVRVDEYLVINVYTKKHRWLSKLPTKLGAYDVAIRVKAVVKVPDSLPVMDLGEVTIPELEASAQASMQ